MATLSRRALLLAGGVAAAGMASAGAASTDDPPLGPGGAAGAPPREESPAYVCRLAQLPPIRIPEEAMARKGNKAAWPVLQGISIASVEIAPQGLRAPHFHPNTPELVVVVRGQAQAGLIGPNGQRQIVDLETGDGIFFPTAWPHWLRNTGAEPLLTFFNYAHEQPETFEVADVDAFVAGA